jgi:hypothetical protein
VGAGFKPKHPSCRVLSRPKPRGRRGGSRAAEDLPQDTPNPRTWRGCPPVNLSYPGTTTFNHIVRLPLLPLSSGRARLPHQGRLDLRLHPSLQHESPGQGTGLGGDLDQISSETQPETRVRCAKRPKPGRTSENAALRFFHAQAKRVTAVALAGLTTAFLKKSELPSRKCCSKITSLRNF